jgi:type II secretory pathway component GspD/PulD (secretin)
MRTLPLPSLAVAALFAVASTAPAFAQAGAAPVAQPAAAPAESPLADKPATPDAAAAPVAKGKDAAGRDTLSVDFPDEDVRNILRNVADLFELNIIMPETLQGKTTIKLREVTWRQIFSNVLDPVGYTYIEDGNIIKIVSKESLNDEPVTTEVILINSARAADILPTISSLVDPTKGKIVVDARSNSLVITERPTRFNRIRPIIEQLDRATDQVMIEAKFVEVTDRDVKNIGVNWASLANYNVSVGGIQGSVDRSRGQTRSDGQDGKNSNTVNNVNSTATTNTQGNGANNANTVTSTNGTVTATASSGTNGAITSQTTATVSNGTTVDNALNLLNSIANTGATNRTLQAVFNADEFKLVLSALQSQNDVKIVSNPTIVTLNNSEATINVGEEDPIPNYTYNQERGSFEVSGFNYKPIGVNLKVTPQVNARGDIKLTLAPEVSQPNGSVTFGGAGGAQIPIVATRKITTTVEMKDGYTMGIGGLLKTQETKTGSKVPVLGSVPVLGRLFRSDSKEKQVQNLIIFITAKTLSSSGAPVEQVFDSERVRQLQMRREDMPGHRDGSSPFVTEPAKNTSSRLTTPGASK